MVCCVDLRHGYLIVVGVVIVIVALVESVL